MYVGPVAGVAPDPEADLIDWYWQKNFYLIDSSSVQLHRFPIDIRSARRIRGEDRGLTWVIKNSSGSAGTLVQSVSFRFLLELG